jgi:hypothetical protein
MRSIIIAFRPARETPESMLSSANQDTSDGLKFIRPFTHPNHADRDHPGDAALLLRWAGGGLECPA